MCFAVLCLLAPPWGVVKNCRSLLLKSTRVTAVIVISGKIITRIDTGVQNGKIIILVLTEPWRKVAFTVTLLILSNRWYHYNTKTQCFVFSSKLQQHDPYSNSFLRNMSMACIQSRKLNSRQIFDILLRQRIFDWHHNVGVLNVWASQWNCHNDRLKNRFYT